MIEVKNLTKKYGDFVAVNDVSFNVEDGEVFAFLGPNGAGKSTTIKMLTTLLRPTSGTVSLNDVDPVEEPEKARRTFGIVFQDPSLDDDLTAWENMDLHGVLYDISDEDRRKRIEELLNFVDLWDRKDSPVKEFSGGMKRRLEIARGLLHKPKILFLDEPTTGLDTQTRSLMWDRLEQLNKTDKMTIFLTTHQMEEADRIATRIAIMDHGKIMIIGTSEELKKKTNTNSLDEAFLALTGRAIREEEGDSNSRMKMMHRGRR
ncbi:MAG: ATP-binding cassette domain-containing protein [Candidatus Pacebacteria bacterium]|nr:ATP-binding cassette domain-containing protein [Candidatus Paceibacterota bacterium]